MMRSTVDYTAPIPCCEEIRARCREAERKTQTDAQGGFPMAALMTDYRKSNRLALTWGWFFQKLLLSRDGEEESDIAQVEREILKIISAVWRERQDETEYELEPGAIRFMEMLLRKEPKTDELEAILGRLHRSCPFFAEQIYCLGDTGEALLTLEQFPKAEEWYALQKWLEQWKNVAGGTFVSPVVEKLCEAMKRVLRYEQICYLREYVKGRQELEEAFAGGIVGRYFNELLYIVQKKQRQNEHVQEYGEMCRCLAAEGVNPFRILFREKELPDGVMAESAKAAVKALQGVLELCGGEGEIDLADMDAYLGHTSYWIWGRDDRLRTMVHREETLRILKWAAVHLRVTDRMGEGMYEVQYLLFQDATEEELVYMHMRGVFPKRTIRELAYEARKSKDMNKLPLLIQWMHEEEQGDGRA